MEAGLFHFYRREGDFTATIVSSLQHFWKI